MKITIIFQCQLKRNQYNITTIIFTFSYIIIIIKIIYLISFCSRTIVVFNHHSFHSASILNEYINKRRCKQKKKK